MFSAIIKEPIVILLMLICLTVVSTGFMVRKNQVAFLNKTKKPVNYTASRIVYLGSNETTIDDFYKIDIKSRK